MAQRAIQRGTQERLKRDMIATIFALSSGRLPAGIAIVRISGPRSFLALTEMTTLPLPTVRNLVRRRLIDPRDDTTLDEAMVVAFAGPASATGDDLVELHVHGGPAVLAVIFDVLRAMPELRLADPGEFTRRAFDNNKLDLAQAEGLADLIGAETESQRRQALRQAGGRLSDKVGGWRSTLIEVRADLEATLDFADEDDVPAELTPDGRARLEALVAEMALVLADAGRGERLRDGLTVALTGAANTGKSSLFNALARRDVAIVSEEPGTTRDVIEVRLDLGGSAVTLLDTAGYRETIDPVELEGLRRGRARAADADLVIAIGASCASVADLLVISKVDETKIKAGWHEDALYLSARTGEGIDELENWLANWARDTLRSAEPALITRERHRAAVASGAECITVALTVADPVLIADLLRHATVSLDTVIGRIIGADDLLDSVFSRFCIGK